MGISGGMIDDVLEVLGRFGVVALAGSLGGFGGGAADGCFTDCEVFIGGVVGGRFLGRNLCGLFAGMDFEKNAGSGVVVRW